MNTFFYSAVDKSKKLINWSWWLITELWGIILRFLNSKLGMPLPQAKTDYQIWLAYWYLTINKIKEKLDSYQIRNSDDYSQALEMPYNKYLRVYHNHTGYRNTCEVYLTKDKTIIVKFMRGTGIVESHYEYNKFITDNVIDTVVNAILTIEGYGNVAAGRLK